MAETEAHLQPKVTKRETRVTKARDSQVVIQASVLDVVTLHIFKVGTH